MTDFPEVVARYYNAAEVGDLDAIVECFAEDGRVHGEDRDYRGHGEIRAWREGVANRFTYTTQITQVTQEGPDVHVVHTHLEGDFPGGVVDLQQRFTVAEGLIRALEI